MKIEHLVASIVLGMIVAVACAFAAGLIVGSLLGRAETVRDCASAGQFMLKGAVYECRPLEASSYYGLDTFR